MHNHAAATLKHCTQQSLLSILRKLHIQHLHKIIETFHSCTMYTCAHMLDILLCYATKLSYGSYSWWGDNNNNGVKRVFYVDTWHTYVLHGRVFLYLYRGMQKHNYTDWHLTLEYIPSSWIHASMQHGNSRLIRRLANFTIIYNVMLKSCTHKWATECYNKVCGILSDTRSLNALHGDTIDSKFHVCQDDTNSLGINTRVS